MTCSIIAKDLSTGEIGGGVFTHWFGSSNVLSGRAGIGMIATQALTNNSYSTRGLELLDDNMNPEDVLEYMTSSDELRDMRQAAVLNNDGKYFQHSGEKCIDHVSMYSGNGFCVQANMMENSSIAQAVGNAFEDLSNLSLAERILESLRAGEKAGGDVRGKQSCALVTLSSERKEPWQNYNIELKVDDNDRPLEELSRLLRIKRGYELLDKAEGLFAEGNHKEAMLYFQQAKSFLGKEHKELQFWKTDAMIKMGMIGKEEGFSIIKGLGENWIELYKRL